MRRLILPIAVTMLTDPVARGVRVVVADAASAVLLDVTVPGGAYDESVKTGWKVKKTTWTWQGNLDGLTKAHGRRPRRPLRETWFAAATCVSQTGKGKISCK
jgi:hypothetical protein